MTLGTVGGQEGWAGVYAQTMCLGFWKQGFYYIVGKVFLFLFKLPHQAKPGKRSQSSGLEATLPWGRGSAGEASPATQAVPRCRNLTLGTGSSCSEHSLTALSQQVAMTVSVSGPQLQDSSAVWWAR